MTSVWTRTAISDISNLPLLGFQTQYLSVSSASSCCQLLMTDLIWSLPSIISDLFDVKNESEGMLDGREKSDKDSLLFDFSLIQNSRIVLGRSLERTSISFFVHTKKKGNPPKLYAPKKYFQPSFSFISHGEKLF